VDDLVDVARINTNKIELRRKPVALQEIIEQAASMCRPLVDERRHALTVNVPSSRVILDADAVRLTQVMANLITNAARCTDEGGSIRIDCATHEDAVEVAISDTGRGIAPDLLPRIFDLFVQGRTMDGAGLGLGLAIVKRLVEMHDGTISVSSPGVGLGSEFRVRLPIATDTVAAAVDSDPDPPALTAPARPLTIALVEDNEDLREGLVDLLSTMGHEVEAATDGETGAELILRLEPDVAFVDIGLPRMDGYGVAARVRAQLGDRVRLVAMSGFGQASDLERSREAGYQGHIVKPPDVETLRRILSPEQRD
jgi:CheY-like chemotaxis protein